MADIIFIIQREYTVVEYSKIRVFVFQLHLNNGYNRPTSGLHADCRLVQYAKTYLVEQNDPIYSCSSMPKL